MTKQATGQQYAYRVAPGTRVRLRDYDPRDTHGLRKSEGKALLDQLDDELGALQELLYATDQHSVLLILQGLDTSGKDCTIKHVLKKVNPAGCRVVPFKQPTPQELAHDFLWRVHANTPARGQLGVFNRSHYEDVVIVRVHKLVPEEVWRRRYAHINAFEHLLADANTIIKCFLHISKDEQKERLLAREQDVTKAWKLSAGDWVERRAWDDHQAAYEEALSECSTDVAPWYIVPADRKWYRNLAIANLLVSALRPHKQEWLAHLDALGKVERAEVLKACEAASQPDGKHH